MTKQSRLHSEMRRQNDADLLSRLKAMHSPAELVEAVNVPLDLAAALITHRTELLSLAAPRAMNADEVAKLYDFIKVLIETNWLLIAHAGQVSNLADNAYQQMKGSMRKLVEISQFADFTAAGDDDDDE